MKLIGYSPNPGHGSVSSSLVAMGIICAARGLKVLLLDSQWNGDMSRALLPRRLTRREDYLATTGIDEIIRLCEGNGLDKESIKGGIISIDENLDLVSHSTKPIKEMYEKQFVRYLPEILKILEQQYDVILVDVLTYDLARQQRVLDLADRIYVFLPQNNWLLKQYFDMPIQNSNIYYILTQYESHSILNPFNLKMKYKELRKKSIQTIPFDGRFLDGWSDSRVTSLLTRYELSVPGDKDYRFIHSLEKIAKSIQRGVQRSHDRNK